MRSKGHILQRGGWYLVAIGWLRVLRLPVRVWFHVALVATPTVGLTKSVAMTLTGDNQTRVGFSDTTRLRQPGATPRGPGLARHPSDIYSLGATLWYLLCGRAPFRGSSVGEVRHERLPLEQLGLAYVPEPVVILLRSMLAVEPGGRPASARELLTTLRRCRQVIANPLFSFT
jgi:serine/threonine protein kinase